MIEPSNLGPKLKPPAGGLTRLRQSLDQFDTASRHPGNWVVTGLIVCLVALLVAIVWRDMIQTRRMDLAVQDAMATAQETHFDHAAYQVLPSHDRSVQILLIGTLPPNDCMQVRSAERDRNDSVCTPRS
jgi:hypothetical protein